MDRYVCSSFTKYINMCKCIYMVIYLYSFIYLFIFIVNIYICTYTCRQEIENNKYGRCWIQITNSERVLKQRVNRVPKQMHNCGLLSSIGLAVPNIFPLWKCSDHQVASERHGDRQFPLGYDSVTANMVG